MIKKQTLLLKIRLGVAVFWFFLPGYVFAANTDTSNLPAGASADVVSARLRDQAEQVLAKKEEKKPAEPEEEKKDKPAFDSRPFFVKKINLKGDLLIPAAEYEPIIHAYENRELTFTDVRDVMDKIEAAFRAHGYLAVVSLPPQKLENREINMELIISRMGKVSVEGNRWFSQRLILRQWDMREGSYLKYDEIREAAIKMSGNPDRLVRPILKAGSEKRTTDIVLKVEDHFPGHADFTFDNQGVKLTGKQRAGFMLRHNNFLGLDDTMLVGTSFGKRFGALFLNYVLPITNFGTSFTGNYSHAQVNPLKEFADLGINSVSNTYGLGLKQDLFQTARFSGNLQSGFTFKEKYTRILSVISSWDKERVLDFGGSLQERDSLGATNLIQNFAFGMPNRGDGYPLASRHGEHSFFKYHGNIARQVKMPWKTYLMANGEWQLTPDRLLPQEQLFLGGAESVRGYPESDHGADEGFVLQIEYWIPTYFLPQGFHLPRDKTDLRDRLKFLLFFDQGYGRVLGPQSNEHRSRYLAGTGFGGDFAFRNNLSLRVEWGWRVGDRAETEHGSNQIHFGLHAGF